MRILLPDTGHEHDLPDNTHLPLYSLAECAICRKWFGVGEAYVGFGFNNIWVQVRWYHFRLQRRIRAEMRRRGGLIEQHISDDFEPPSMAS